MVSEQTYSVSYFSEQTYHRFRKAFVLLDTILKMRPTDLIGNYLMIVIAIK